MEKLAVLIPGAHQLKEWIRHWPNFHDAEVISFSLNAGASSFMRVKTWDTSSELDEQGYFRRSKFVTVEFVMESLVSCTLAEIHLAPAIIFGLEITHSEDMFSINLDPCYEMYGNLMCRTVRVSLVPA